MSRSRDLLFVLVTLALVVTVHSDSRGLWLLPRKDCCNTARADIAGNMKAAPREIWSYGASSSTYTYLAPICLKKKIVYLAQVGSGLRLIRPDGSIIWKRAVMGVGKVDGVVDVGGKPAALVTIGMRGFSLIDIATGEAVWTWDTPAGSFLGGYRLLREGNRTRLIVFPQNTMFGFCFEIGKKPKLLWQHDYTGRYWQNYGPFFVLADMDKDGTPEIVLVGKPSYAAVIDTKTGGIKCDISYEIPGGDHFGRPYGLINATDVDGDGYRDLVVVSCQVEEYVSVIRNNAGKSLSPIWAHCVGKDYPTEPVKLRPNTTSIADVNGDGKKELVTGVFNETGDGRWHTLVIDACKGWNSRFADLPDRYFWGCYDLDGNGRDEILTSTETAALVPGPTSMQAIDGRSCKDLASTSNISLSPVAVMPPQDTGYHANVMTPAYLTTQNGVEGILVGRNGREYLWNASGGKSTFYPIQMTDISRVALSSEGSGRIGRCDLTIGKPAAAGLTASWPLVSQYKGIRELIVSRSDGMIIGGEPDFGRPGRFRRSWSLPGMMPSAWIGKNGVRTVYAAHPTDDVVLVYEPRYRPPAGQISIPMPMPINRPWLSRSTAELLPFGEVDPQLYAGLRPGVHAIAGAMFGTEENLLWHDKENGPYPRIAAAADLNGDGAYEVVADNHGRHIIYDAKGNGRTVAVGWGGEIPGRGDGAKYSVPIVGPFGPNGATRIVMSGGLDALETLDASGNRVAKCPFASCYDFQWCGAAVANIRNTNDWDVGTMNCYGVFYCSDVNTCQTRWTLDLGVQPITCANISSGDVDADGRDNFIVGLPDGRLAVLDEKDGKGRILWQKRFDAGVEEAFLADVDGDGTGEMIVDLDDGQIKILKAKAGQH